MLGAPRAQTVVKGLQGIPDFFSECIRNFTFSTPGGGRGSTDLYLINSK